ncbi:MAG: GNAT family N-acetyltransferase [Pseudohongiellaceae bacterium]
MKSKNLQGKLLSSRICFINAQSHAPGFYKKFGFEHEDKEFMEAGIAHFRMEQRLSPLQDQQQRKMQTGELPKVKIRRFDTAEVSWSLGNKLVRALRRSVFQEIHEIC